MKFNAKKCNIMRVSRSRKPLQHFYSLGNEILQEVSDAKYLGIQIDNKLDWNKHISTVAARGQSKLAFLNRNLKGCPKKLRDTAYISLIRPALEYSCSVWHPHKKVIRTKLKKFSAEQLDLFRTILGVKQVSQICYTRLKRRTSSRQPTPVQGRITASNSNTSRQIVIHIACTLFFQPLFQAGTTFHLALRRLTV